MRKTTALLAALLATACGTQKLSPAEIRDAMPSADVVKISAPNPNAGAMVVGDPALGAAPAVASPKAPLAVTSYLFALAVNGGVFWTLAPIAWLTTAVPPTSCTDKACTWGPGSGAAELNDWMLVVAKAGERYDFTLSGQKKTPAGSPWVPVITGYAYPGATAHRGHGAFAVDFDQVWAGLAHPAGAVQQDFGTISVDWDGRTSLHLDVTFLGARNGEAPGADPANPNRVNAVYAFDATGTGGDLKLGFRTLPPYVGVVAATATLHTRWQAGGAGVADFSYLRTGASLSFSQCWAGAPDYGMTFDGSGPTGDAGLCVFTPLDPVVITVP
jgi:hypothetical protein